MGSHGLAAVASGGLVVSLADPQLPVLGLLILGWIVDRILAAVEQLRGPGAADCPDRRARGGDPDARAADGNHPTGAE